MRISALRTCCAACWMLDDYALNGDWTSGAGRCGQAVYYGDKAAITWRSVMISAGPGTRTRRAEDMQIGIKSAPTPPSPPPSAIQYRSGATGAGIIAVVQGSRAGGGARARAPGFMSERSEGVALRNNEQTVV
ncbi:hypothetical protein EVG20_g9515 [Dentipellis fragilis]|uniref:Uncharacterized protein n=1 Tax=Dentipellis fragilis TaxID=205917 RepID=A0A4Y9XXN3_9AGAM|nr:hypothetical protein EVG20_g9515 [Dentipellis fragilis]